MSVELILVLPLLFAMLLAVVEVAMLLSAQQLMETAATEACRVGTLPLATEEDVRETARDTLVRRSLAENHEVCFEPASSSGEMVRVCIRVPMRAAAPDMLGLIGFGLGDRCLTARSFLPRQ